MNLLAHLPRFPQMRRIALSLMLGLALLAPVQAFAVTVIRVVTVYYVFGVEVWRTVEYVTVAPT